MSLPPTLHKALMKSSLSLGRTSLWRTHWVYVKMVTIPASIYQMVTFSPFPGQMKEGFSLSLLGELCGCFEDKTYKYGAPPQSGQPGIFISQASSHSASISLSK